MRRLFLTEREFKKLPLEKQELYSSFLCEEIYNRETCLISKFQIINNGYPVASDYGTFKPRVVNTILFCNINGDINFKEFFKNLSHFLNANSFFSVNNEYESFCKLLEIFKINRHRDPLQYFCISDVAINNPVSIFIEVNFRRWYLLSFTSDGLYDIIKIKHAEQEENHYED